MNLRFQKAIIEKFRLSLKLSCLKNAFCIDEWIRMVTSNCIKELDLDITRLDAKEDWYSLPGTVFTAKSLMVLRLRGLKLEWPLIVNHINLSKLKELSLTDVFLEERTILEICSACPEIEDLRLIRCQGVKDLLTSDLSNLLKLTIDQQFETLKKSIQIRAVFLRTLYYSGCNITVKFDVSKFKHLKELGKTFGEITDSIVENIVAELPLLEELELSFCLKSTRLKFSSCVLRKLTFYSTKSLTEIGMDTPNLLHYTYRAPKLPVIFSMTPSSIQESFLQLKPDDQLNTIWFENLREHLTRFKKLNSLFLRIESATVILSWEEDSKTSGVTELHKCSCLGLELVLNKFDVEELKATWSRPPFVIEKLMIQKVVQSQNFETLLDVLFWACHPKFVLVGSIWEDNEAFIQFLRENLMDREVVPACCDSRRVKCWRHYLKEVEVKYSMNHQYGDSSPSCKVAILSFKLTW
ncbi:hypothetical protein BC332_16345 [Capsicum chinense]|nr:hypothetical protein BC332_16345 [Capsicum chinense]